MSQSTASGSADETVQDVAPENQGGSYNTDYDNAYLAASQSTGTPFALIKAHAIRESNQNPNAIRHEPGTSKRPPSASYGLTQILWWQSSNRFKNYGWSDDRVGDGSVLFDPTTNAFIGASIMQENIKRFDTLRDAINAYNTGAAEATREAPNNYVEDVLKYYHEILGS